MPALPLIHEIAKLNSSMICCIFLIFIVTAGALIPSLRADDAALNEGAYGPEPLGERKSNESVIAMASEKIEVQFGRKTSDVHATFVFRSTKPDAPARQLVGFPDLGLAVEEAKRRDPKANASWFPQEGTVGPLEKLRTFVNGKEVKSRLEYGFVEWTDDGWKRGTPQNGTLMAWHVMWVDFPPDKDVTVERRYRVPNGEMVYGISLFEYITSTGAAWHGPIGRMDVEVTLDGWTVHDLAWKNGPRKQISESGPFCIPDKPEWEIVSPTKLRFTWKNFEPRTDKEKRSFELATIGKIPRK